MWPVGKWHGKANSWHLSLGPLGWKLWWEDVAPDVGVIPLSGSAVPHTHLGQGLSSFQVGGKMWSIICHVLLSWFGNNCLYVCLLQPKGEMGVRAVESETLPSPPPSRTGWRAPVEYFCVWGRKWVLMRNKITRTRNRASPFPRLTCQNICSGNDKEIEPWPHSLHGKNLF